MYDLTEANEANASPFFLRCFEHRMTVPTLDLFGKLDPSLHLQPGTYKAPKPDGSEKLVAESGTVTWCICFGIIESKRSALVCTYIRLLRGWVLHYLCKCKLGRASIAMHCKPREKFHRDSPVLRPWASR